MRFASLGSGSKGNATLVEAGETRLLIDCGFPRREFARRMALRHCCPSQLDAILVTHEHSDHAAGVGAIARHWDIPVYLTHGTAASGRIGDVPQALTIHPGERFVIGEIEVDAVAVPHDAREPVQYVFNAMGTRLGLLTDLGSITPHVIAAYSHCDALLLEFNHDLELLQHGPYPPALKRRVAGDWGHLNNEQATALLAAADTERLHTLVVGHISQQNNALAKAEAAVAASAAAAASTVVYACQGEGFDWLDCRSVDVSPLASALEAAG